MIAGEAEWLVYADNFAFMQYQIDIYSICKSNKNMNT